MRVFIIAAMSADGFIARGTNELADWTPKADKKLFMELTKRAGVFVMGATTYRTIGHPLRGRRNIIYTRGTITGDGVETTQEPPQQLIDRLSRDGCSELAVCGGRSIYELFLHASVVDELYLTVVPVLFGAGITLAQTASGTILTLLESTPLGEDAILLHYAVKKK
ncbi:MAG TPA: dihydrofolate reductase family protein [Candidatus Saccharimonadales bacterium]|jgi:dihydrofolate reductase